MAKARISIGTWAYLFNQEQPTNDFHTILHKLQDLGYDGVELYALEGERLTPEILADAAYAIFNRPARQTTGNFFIDEEVLRAEGMADFSPYSPGSVDQAKPLQGDFFVPDAVFDRSPTKIKRAF